MRGQSRETADKGNVLVEKPEQLYEQRRNEVIKGGETLIEIIGKVYIKEGIQNTKSFKERRDEQKDSMIR